MSINTILEQARLLSHRERKELTKQLIDLLDAPQVPQPSKTQEHWGEALSRLFEEVGPIELKYPEIEDPVEWVKRLRADERRRRLGDLADWENEE